MKRILLFASLLAMTGCSLDSLLSSIIGDAAGVEYVDLGLSVKWATCNLRTSSPQEIGEWYMWAGTEPQEFDGEKTAPYYSEEEQKFYMYSDYIYNQITLQTDGLMRLQVNDDPAHYKLKGNWRMPTGEEWQELLDNCTWTPSADGSGVTVTSNVEGYTDKSIFLPYYYYYDDQRGDTRVFFWYWSTDLYEPDPTKAVALRATNVQGDNFVVSSASRNSVCMVRPVLTNGYVYPESIELDQTSLTMEVGEIRKLNVTFSPEDAYYNSLEWQYEGDCIIQVGNYIIAVNPGNAVVTANAYQGRNDCTAKCHVTVSESSSSATTAVDLGLDVKWSDRNLEALSPVDPGGLYQWAGTNNMAGASRDTLEGSCPYYVQHPEGYEPYYSKYSIGWGYERPIEEDRKSELEPEDDAANVILGGGWRMPSRSEWSQLRSRCLWTLVTDWNSPDFNGFLITSKKKGYEDKQIFLPISAGTSCWDIPFVYWTPRLGTHCDKAQAHCIYLYGKHEDADIDRYNTCSIRPVI